MAIQHLTEAPRLFSVGLAVPSQRYPQPVLARQLASADPKILRFFTHPHIQHRHLVLPVNGDGSIALQEESNGELLEKFKTHGLRLSGEALSEALRKAGLQAQDIDFLCCVSSTGFIVPALSAWVVREYGLRSDCQRIDIGGMGCNAGLNALNAVSSWCRANPGKKAVMICAEICSAMYTLDPSERTAIVNSLFGDGVSACVLGSESEELPLRRPNAPRILGFESQIISDHVDNLRLDWDDSKHRYSFYIDKQTPKALSSQIESPIDRLLSRFKLTRGDVRHWIAHTGGSAILDGIEKKLGLEPDALRHTRSVLRDFGNLSSGSFLFSYSRLLEEGRTGKNDYAVMMTMGPGLTIETALLRFE